MGVKFLTPINGRPCKFSKQKENHAISRQMCVDHCILLFKHLSTHMHFITNGNKRFSKTNSTDPRQRVPVRKFDTYAASIQIMQKRLDSCFLPIFSLCRPAISFERARPFSFCQRLGHHRPWPLCPICCFGIFNFCMFLRHFCSQLIR